MFLFNQFLDSFPSLPAGVRLVEEKDLRIMLVAAGTLDASRNKVDASGTAGGVVDEVQVPEEFIIHPPSPNPSTEPSSPVDRPSKFGGSRLAGSIRRVAQI
jgi:hypothetical protein